MPKDSTTSIILPPVISCPRKSSVPCHGLGSPRALANTRRGPRHRPSARRAHNRTPATSSSICTDKHCIYYLRNPYPLRPVVPTKVFSLPTTSNKDTQTTATSSRSLHQRRKPTTGHQPPATTSSQQIHLHRTQWLSHRQCRTRHPRPVATRPVATRPSSSPLTSMRQRQRRETLLGATGWRLLQADSDTSKVRTWWTWEVPGNLPGEVAEGQGIA